jgi:two-component system response regulator DctR
MTSPIVQLDEPIVIIIDDDESLVSSLAIYLEAKKIRCLSFFSGEDFLLASKIDSSLLTNPGCILLDIRMPGLSGPQVFDQILVTHKQLIKPVIFITGHGETQIAVELMKRGAYDFIQKPFDSEALLKLVKIALTHSVDSFNKIHFYNIFNNKINSLSKKELEIMNLIYQGASNKDIADQYENSVRTIELHRAHIFAKLEVKNGIELARNLERVSWSV